MAASNQSGGLWIRNGRFIARVTAENEQGKKEIRWVTLSGAETVPQAHTAAILDSQSAQSDAHGGAVG